MAAAGAMDSATLALLVQLKLEDLDSLANNGKCKSREGQASDETLAQKLYREVLEGAAAVATDSRMAESVALAVQHDGPTITDANVAADDVLARDRELAQELYSGRSFHHHQPNDLASSQFLDDEIIAKLEALYVQNPLGNSGGSSPPSRVQSEVESSCQPQRCEPYKEPLRRRCEACRTPHDFFGVARVPCGHRYCRICLLQLLRAATHDEGLFPPRCCRQPINMHRVKMLVPTDLMEELEEKRVEFEAVNRTYCYQGQCSRFIPEEHTVNDVATCSSCNSRTCITCKAEAHDGDCPEDEGLRQALELAEQQGWQRCTRCWTGVELGEGCYHITCRCGYEFCYVCAECWKNCTCDEWNPVRLRRRAIQLVDRNQDATADAPEVLAVTYRLEEQEAEAAPDPQSGDAPSRSLVPDPPVTDRMQEIRAQDYQLDRQVQFTIQNLLESQDCTHNRWQRVRGPYQCEECYYTLPKNIFECRQCRILACNQCRRNRI